MKGRLRWKLAVGMLLAVFAALSLVSVLGSLGALPTSAPAAEDEGYLLREYEGYVAVWYPAGATSPAMVTDIRTSDLPLADRAELREGVPAADRGAVMRLLEDFAA